MAAHGGHDDAHGHDAHGHDAGHEAHADAHGKDTQGVKPAVAAYSPSEEARKRWWSMPFDTATNFSLLGYFLGWIMDRNDERVDLHLND